MSVHRRGDKWEVRYRDGFRQRSKTFDRKADADVFDTEARRRRQHGTLSGLTAGQQTLDNYIEHTWAPTYAPLLAANTISGYTYLADNQISPWLGQSRLRELTADQIRAWQAALLRDGCPADQVGRALGRLGNVLQRALESGLIATNPARLVRKPPRDPKPEVRPLAPETVETIRGLLKPRDRMLVSLSPTPGCDRRRPCGCAGGTSGSGRSSSTRPRRGGASRGRGPSSTLPRSRKTCASGDSHAGAPPATSR
jgi:Phage integrase, N-terminal SAM-like domain